MKTWLKKRLSGEEKKGVERCSPPRSTQESPGSEDFGLQYGESMGDVDDYLSALSSEEDLLDRHLSSAAEEQPVVVHENGVRFEAVLVFRDSATSAPTQAEVWLCPTASMLVVHRRGLLLQMRKSPAMFVLPWEALRVQEAREGMFSVYADGHEPMLFRSKQCWAATATITAMKAVGMATREQLIQAAAVVGAGRQLSIQDTSDSEGEMFGALSHALTIDGQLTSQRIRLFVTHEAVHIMRVAMLGGSKLLFRLGLSQLHVSRGPVQGALLFKSQGCCVVVSLADEELVLHLLTAFIKNWGGWARWPQGVRGGPQAPPAPWGVSLCALKDLGATQVTLRANLMVGGKAEQRHLVLSDTEWLLCLVPHKTAMGWAFVDFAYEIKKLRAIKQDQASHRMLLEFAKEPKESPTRQLRYLFVGLTEESAEAIKMLFATSIAAQVEAQE